MAKEPSQPLTRYHGKRDFDRTPEPEGTGDATGAGERFVVQRHRARRDHYDLRLELDGVLVSWAVPKGPTRDPQVRRLAVRVEDHPLEYLDFEGVIPAGEYGGGDVIVWDRGHWELAESDDAAAAIQEGNLHFDLYGDKLAGRFVLALPSGKEDERQWLLLHKHDDYAQDGWDCESYPRSVKSGYTNTEIAADPPAVWDGAQPASHAEVPLSRDYSATLDPEELQALRDLPKAGTWNIDGRTVRLTNLDKVLIPGDGTSPATTKRDLIAYYCQVAPYMLPYLAARPLNTHRFPDGITRSGFWQRQLPRHTPEWMRRWRHEHSDGHAHTYLIPEEIADLAWLANYGALELHAWTARLPRLDRPTWVLFDIDPGNDTSFDEVLILARLHRTALAHLGVEGRPKVTGQRGVQIWVPVEPRYSFAETRRWAKNLSYAVGHTAPELVSWAWHTERRRGLARLDYTQNASNKTLVAPYSARPRAGAAVSVPLEWDELDDPKLRPDKWTVHTVGRRLDSAGDPFAALTEVTQTLPRL